MGMAKGASSPAMTTTMEDSAALILANSLTSATNQVVVGTTQESIAAKIVPTLSPQVDSNNCSQQNGKLTPIDADRLE